MTIDSTSLSLTTLIGVLIVVAGAFLGLCLKYRAAALGLRGRLRVMAYLMQYDAALEYHGLRRRELRARVNELRTNLVESAADGGVAAAIHRLGPPRVLAAEVAGSRMVPSWSRGSVWVAAAVAIGLFGFFMSASAFLSAVESGATTGATATWSPFFLTMSATAVSSGPPTFTVEFPFVMLALLLVPFALGARVWRLWTGERPPNPTSPQLHV